MKRNSFFGGHVPSFMSPCACIIAGLMALASTGAYASTKSAAEGEVNTPVEALIPMAKDYVANNNIDADSSATINNSEELAKLLSGTLSGSIEELTSEDISKKLAEKDAEKIFTTFMTTNNSEQAEKNKEILNAGMNTISDTYKNIQNGFKQITHYVDILHPQLESIPKILDIIVNEEDFEIRMLLVNNVFEWKKQVLANLDSINNELGNLNNMYKNITDQDNILILQQQKQIEEAKDSVDNLRISDDYKNEIKKVFDETGELRNQTEYVLKTRYSSLEKNDIALLKMLLQQQTEFNEDGKSSAEEQAASKDLLKGLVENATPMTRNYIIKLAEEQYKPENDPTGIEDVNTSAKVDGNVYKTATEIYRLDGQSITVYDYSGKILRTEPLDLKIHTGFAQ